MKNILLSTAIAAVPFAFASSVQAACDDLSPGGGQTVTCTGLETGSLDDGSSLVTVNIQSGGSIDTTASGDDAIKLKDTDNTVNVSASGAIQGGDEAIVGGDRLEVNNSGAITSVDHAIVGENEDDSDAVGVIVNNLAGASIHAGKDAVKAGDNLSVTNHGLMTSGDDLVQADGAFGVTIDNYGMMNATDKGITVDDGASLTLTNYSGAQLTSAENEAVEAGDEAFIVNAGTIQAFDDAIQAGRFAYIENWGLIENTQTFADVDPVVPGIEAQDAIDIDSGTIFNMAGGAIRSTTNAAIDFDPTSDVSDVFNSGVISGTIAINTDDADMGAQQVTQFGGSIIGTSGLALNLGMGEDILDWHGGAISGSADFGAGNDAALLSVDLFLTDPVSSFEALGLLNGGADEDMFSLTGVSLLNDIDVALSGDILSLTIFGNTTLQLTSWESFTFAEGIYSFDDVANLVAPVPLPAGVLLMGTAIAGLGAMSRRKAST